MESRGVSLESIYIEVKAISERLDFLEELVETVIVRELPKAKLSKEEIGEIRKAVAEMKGGTSITLEELKGA